MIHLRPCIPDTPTNQSVGSRLTRPTLRTLENSDSSSSEISCNDRRNCMIARSTRWPAKEIPLAIRILRCSTSTGITLRKRRALNSSIAMAFERSLRGRHQPLAGGGDVGKEFDGFGSQHVHRGGIGMMPAAARGRIAQERDAMAAMRGVDRGRQASLLCDEAGNGETSDLRNDVGEKLV